MSPTIDPSQYDALLAQKVEHVRGLFSGITMPSWQVIPSKPLHYRMRAEFQVWHDGDRSYYRMFDSQTRKPYEVTEFLPGSETIHQLMQAMMEAISGSDVLRHKLFQIEFLTTQTGQALVSLLYHRQLGEEWEQPARELAQQFGVQIIGRARKQKWVLDTDFVTETLAVEGKNYQYTQYENSFTQPNAMINEQMLTWASEASRAIAERKSGDLLELYCGNGNFTCVLAQHFNRVLATEISKTSVASAKTNFALNGVGNVEVARLSSEEFTEALNKVRAFNRLSQIDLDSYHFSTIFVDPPRAGLDDGTLALTARFDNIIYISCNPETLRANLAVLCKTHEVEKVALFDQFPYTHHAEMGVILRRR